LRAILKYFCILDNLRYVKVEFCWAEWHAAMQDLCLARKHCSDIIIAVSIYSYLCLCTNVTALSSFKHVYRQLSIRK